MTSAPGGESSRPPLAADRIVSLDQFRGWAIFFMVLVNFLGEYRSMPKTMRHHEWGLSFADVVVPAFLFAV
jgi:predicted acyltransferase